MADFTLNLVFGSITIRDKDIASLKRMFDRNPIYGGPCLILNRANGLALDAGPDSKAGAHSVLWSAHAAPWQQWRLRKTGDEVEIASASNGLSLTTMATGSKWAETWLDDKVHPDWSRRWKLSSTKDQAAFAIENASSGYALDAGMEPDKDNKHDPHIWPTTWDPWQQWIIARLPFTSER